MGDKVHFLPVKHKSSLQVDRCQSFQVYIVRHTQSTQNNKFAISLQYLKEKIKEEVSAGSFWQITLCTLAPYGLNSINELEANLKWSDKNIFYPMQDQ